MHCEELRGREDKFRYVAACDLLPDRCAKMAERYGCRTYGAIDALLADPEVEMVVIATRSCDHYAHATLALQAGKDVFLEKPMTLTVEEARALQALTATAAGTLYVRHNRRFEPAFQHVREIIAGGILGEVYEIKLRRVGFGRRDDWQTIIALGGGQLLNWGPHIIDHGLRLLESPLADMWSNLKRIAAVGDAEDHLKIILTGENGRVVDLEISGGAALGEPEYRIWGTRGALVSEGDQFILRYLDPAVPLAARQADPGVPKAGTFGTPEQLPWIEETIPIKPRLACDMTSIWDYLYATVREGAPFPITLDEAVSVMDVVTRAKTGTSFDSAVSAVR